MPRNDITALIAVCIAPRSARAITPAADTIPPAKPSTTAFPAFHICPTKPPIYASVLPRDCAKLASGAGKEERAPRIFIDPDATAYVARAKLYAVPIPLPRNPATAAAGADRVRSAPAAAPEPLATANIPPTKLLAEVTAPPRLFPTPRAQPAKPEPVSTPAMATATCVNDLKNGLRASTVVSCMASFIVLQAPAAVLDCSAIMSP